MAKIRTVLTIINEPTLTDTSLNLTTFPAIKHDENEDLVCGSCGMVVGEGVSPRTLYIAAASLLRNRMPVRLVVTCGVCQKYNVVPSEVGQ